MKMDERTKIRKIHKKVFFTGLNNEKKLEVENHVGMSYLRTGIFCRDEVGKALPVVEAVRVVQTILLLSVLLLLVLWPLLTHNSRNLQL